MTDAALSLPVKEVYWLVRLMWGDPDAPSSWNITDANEDIAALNYLFLSRPLMAVRPASNVGTLERRQWEFDIPVAGMSPGLLQNIANGRAHAPITLRAWEIASEGAASQSLSWLNGRVSSAVRNPEGRSEIARLRVQTNKTSTNRSFGVPAMPECEWAEFGDPKTCDRNQVIRLSTLVAGGSLTTVSGLTVTITGLPAQRDRYWSRGYIEKDGVRILIKEWVSGTSFLLSRYIPKEWEDSLPVSVSVTPGCDRRLPTCALWNNVANYWGFGLAIPAYNPSLGPGSG